MTYGEEGSLSRLIQGTLKTSVVSLQFLKVHKVRKYAKLDHGTIYDARSKKNESELVETFFDVSDQIFKTSELSF